MWLESLLIAKSHAKIADFSAGLVEICRVVDASYHKRLLPSATGTSQRERPATANTAAGSTQTAHHLSNPLVTPQQWTNEAAASREAVSQSESTHWQPDPLLLPANQRRSVSALHSSFDASNSSVCKVPFF